MGLISVDAATVGLLGGELCLDFANTVEPRRGDVRSDYLGGYSDLVRWARHAGSLSEEEARRLIGEAERRPSEALAAFAGPWRCGRPCIGSSLPWRGGKNWRVPTWRR